MNTASHYVFMDLDELIKNERYVKLDDISRKYCERYVDDEELQGVCYTITNLVASEQYEDLAAVRKDLRKLINIRRMQAYS